MPVMLAPEAADWDLEGDLRPAGFEVRRFSSDRVPDGLEDVTALLVMALSKGNYGELIPRLPKLRWAQSIFAGIEALLPMLPPDVALTNGRGMHERPVAELTLGLVLAAVRGLHHLRDSQRQSVWDKGAYWARINGAVRLESLNQARVLILGMGSIGLEIAKHLVPFGAHVEGVAMREGEREGFRVHAIGKLDALLPQTDILIMVLPDTPETQGILSRERIALLSSRAWVINVGRGSAIDEEALADAIEASLLGGAGLDVFAKEPLPTDSRLWKLQNVIITPHIAGGGPGFLAEARELVRRNAMRFARGEPLENLIDRTKGY